MLTYPWDESQRNPWDEWTRNAHQVLTQTINEQEAH